jgi:hypothetical protein
LLPDCPIKGVAEMRMLIALIVGIAIGYVAFAPEMASTRQDVWSKIKETAGISHGRPSK